MKKQLYLLSLLILIFFSNAFAQNDNDNCPPLFTRSSIQFPNTKISRIEVLDSNAYLNYPKFIIDQDSINKLINYPEIAKRVGIKGDVVVQISIDSIGMIRDAKLIKAIGAGCDEAILDFLLKTKPKFAPAINMSGKVNSEVLVWFSISFYNFIDKPDLIFDEIVYENLSLAGYTKLTLFKSGNVNYLERENNADDAGIASTIKKNGKLKIEIYNRLSDFMISQCFLDYKDKYYFSASHHATFVTIGVKRGTSEKLVTSTGSGDPVGLWGIMNILSHIQDQIQWEEVKE